MAIDPRVDPAIEPGTRNAGPASLRRTDMTMQLTPKGTRGVRFPRFLRRLIPWVMGPMVKRYRQRGSSWLVNGQPLIVLTTIGARSGERRQVLVNRFPDGDPTGSWLVTGTAGGSASHPGWYVNMVRHPDRVWVEVGGREMRVRPESLQGTEREEAWRLITSLAPRFAGYSAKTDREIPVVRLTPIDEAGAFEAGDARGRG